MSLQALPVGRDDIWLNYLKSNCRNARFCGLYDVRKKQYKWQKRRVMRASNQRKLSLLKFSMGIVICNHSARGVFQFGHKNRTSIISPAVLIFYFETNILALIRSHVIEAIDLSRFSWPLMYANSTS